MLNFPEIDPVALDLGFLQIRWYGLMYLFGFGLGYIYLYFTRNKFKPNWNSEQIFDLIFYIALGVIFGGRIGYIIFYQPGEMINDPLSLVKFWAEGRSFHAGLLGVLLAIYIYARKSKRKFLQITDYISPAVPLSIALGRLGNFINGELWGRTTEVPWGIIFPFAGNKPRHPSQLYELFLEGILLFIILALYSSKPRKSGYISGLFLLLYGIFRFFAEFYREPDEFLGFIWLNWITMGQLLSIPMILAGSWLLLKNNTGKN